jgi:ABC-type multidrug transport system ATPase subunit
VEFCGRNINFRFPNSDNGMHDLSFTLTNGELLAIMGGSGTGKTTLLSLLNGTLKPQEGSITINGHDISEPDAKALIGYVPQDDLLIEELTVYQNLWFTAKLCFEGMSDEDLDKRVMKTLKDLGLDAAKNAAIAACEILAMNDEELETKLKTIRQEAADKVYDDDSDITAKYS